MADEDNVREHGGDADVSTLDALHLDGKGLPGLEDADEQSLPNAAKAEGEDVKGFANVQSAQRTTFERMQQGAPPPEGAIPTGDRVVPDAHAPSEPDNAVEARFQNPFPTFAAEAATEAKEARPAHAAEAPRPAEVIARERPVAEAPPDDQPADATAVATGPEAAPVDETPVIDDEPEEPPLETVAQQAGLLAADVRGTEDRLTRLDISFATQDGDGGGDRIDYLEISGLPDYFDVVDGTGDAIPGATRVGDVWRLPAPTAELVDSLHLKNLDTDDDADFSGSFGLRVTVGTVEPNGTTATITDDITVTIEAVADAPDLAVFDSAGMENTWIPLTITVDSNDSKEEVGAGANAAETQTVYISGMPAGARLNHGSALTDDLTLEDGTIIPSGSWAVASTELTDLKILPPANDSHDFPLTVRVASVESTNGDTAVSAPLTIQVDVGVVAPSASGSGADNEDVWQTLSLSANRNLPDGTETLTVYIKDLPDDAKLAYSNGTPVSQGADGRYEITGQLNNLKVCWNPATKPHSDEDITFTLVAEVRDGDGDADSDDVQTKAPDFNSVEVPVTVTVKAVADAPTLAASAVGVEDQWFDLKINAALVDSDTSETLTVTVTGPAGFELSAGTQSAPGTWSLTQAQLAGLKIRPPQDSDAEFDLTIAATATEAATGDQVAVKTATTTTTITVEVLSDADQPRIDVVDGPQHVAEDTFYNLRGSVAGRYAVQADLNEAGADDGEVKSTDLSETLSFEITAKDAGCRLWYPDEHGVPKVVAMNVGQPVIVSAQDVFDGKILVAGPADWSSATAINFDLRAIATDTDDDAREAALEDGGLALDRQTTRYADDTLTLVIDPVHDSATLVDTNAGLEDHAGGITVDPMVTFTDTDLSERPSGTVDFTSTDAHLAGGRFELNGAPVALTESDGTYTWSVPATAFTQGGNTWTLSGLKFFPATHLAEDVTYSVTVTTQDAAGGSTRALTAEGSIAVTAVADAPPLAVQNVAAMENATIPLTITTGLVDRDGSETLHVYIADLPAGATLNHGARLAVATTLEDGTTIPAGTWIVAKADVGALTLTMPANVSDDLALRVWAATTEARNGDVAVTGPRTLLVDIGIVDPSASGSGSGAEGGWANLSLAANVNAADGTESLRVFIEDLPSGAEIARIAGTGAFPTVTYRGSDGQMHTGYEVTGNLGNVKVRWTDAGNDADIALKVRAIAYDGDADAAADAGGFDRDTAIHLDFSDSADTLVPVTVAISAEADTPTLVVAKAVGVEDKYAVLTIDAGLTDTDGSESLAVYVKLPTETHPGLYLADSAGNPVGTVLTSAELQADGTTAIPAGYVMLTPAQLSGLRIHGLTGDSDADLPITVKAVSTEAGTGGAVGTQVAVRTVTSTVSVFGDADKPLVAVDDDEQTIKEDAFFNLKASIAGYDPVTGRSAETGSAWGGTESGDGSENLSFTITAKEAGSRLWIDANGNNVQDTGEVITMTKDQAVGLTAAQVYGGKVLVGGGANWSGTTDRLHFDLRAVATEDDAAADTAALAGTGLSRQTTRTSDPDTLVLKVEGVADSTTIGSVAAGLEDQAATFKPRFTLADNDGSERIVDNVEIIVAKANFHGGFQHLENGSWVTLAPAVDDGTNYVFRVPATELTTVTQSTATGNATVSDLTTVRFMPDQHSGRDLLYKVRVTTEDANGARLETTTTQSTLTIKAIADAPHVNVGTGAGNVVGLEGSRNDGVGNTVTGTEDTRIGLNLVAGLVDTDGSETLSKAELWSVDDGWTVGYVDAQGIYTAATAMGGGKWSLDTARLGQVVLNPPADRHHLAGDNVTMEFHAWASEGEVSAQVQTRTAESSVNFKVVVNADADAPTLLVSHARTNEDVAVRLDIRPALTDRDGSEGLAIFISDVPEGASFRDGSGTAIGVRGSFDADGRFVADTNGTHWMFTPTQAADLYFLPKQDSNLDPTLTVTARSTEASNGDFAETTGQIKVIVTGVVDGPTGPGGVKLATIGGNLTASGVEDTVIDPNLGAYGTADIDGSEALSVVISNIPDGISVSMSDPSQASYLKYIGGGKWSVDGDHLDYVRFSAPANYAGTFPITLDFIATENDGASLKVTKTMDITVAADADTPSGHITVASQWKGEDAWMVDGVDVGIPFSVSTSVADLGGGNSVIGGGGTEQVTHVTITVDVTGFPGATVVKDGTTWTASNGSIVIDVDIPLDAGTPNTAVTLSGYTLFGVPEDWSKDIPVRLDVVATDVNGDTASRRVDTEITLNPAADAPTVTFSGDSVVGGIPRYDATDGTAVLSGAAAMNDVDQSEAMYFVVKGVPNGVVLSSGYNNGDGSWTVPYSAASWPLTATSHVRAGVATLEVHTVVIDTDQDRDGKTDTWTASQPIRIELDTGTPGGGGTPVTLPSGTVGGNLGTTEDTGFTLAGLTFTVEEGGTLSAVVLDLADGWSIAGTCYYNPTNGTYTVPYDKLGTISVTPPKDFAGAGSLVARVVVTDANGFSTVGDPDGSDGVLGTVIPVDVDAATDGGGFSLSAGTNADGGIYEDAGDVPLSVTLKSGDTDFSEVLVDGTVTITLSDGTRGAIVGTGVEQVNATTYRVALTPDQMNAFADTGQVALTGLSFRPALHFSGSVSLAFSTLAKDVDPAPDLPGWEPASKAVTGSLAITVKAVIDGTTVTALDVGGGEDNAVALDVTIAHQDLGGTTTFGSETLSVVIAGVPDGAIVRGAVNNGDHTWTVKGASLVTSSTGVTLSGVEILPPQDYSGDIALTVTAYAMENGSMVAVSASDTLTVHVAGVADGPTIDPQAASGLEDVAVAIDLNAQLVDLSESMRVTVTGVPAGARFTDADGITVGTQTAAGTWVLPQSALAGLYFVGPPNAAGSWTMTATATAIDGDSTADSNSMAFTVTLTGVADAPTLTVGDLTGGADAVQAAGDEDGGIPLSFAAALADADSESLAVTIEGAPSGTRFQATDGTIIAANTDGKWHVASQYIPGLKMLPPQDWHGEAGLTLTATSSEAGTTATVTATLGVRVDPVNDAPDVTLVTTGQGIPAGTVADPIRVVPGPDTIAVTDVDGSALTGMTVRITSGAGLEDGLGLSGIDLGLGPSGGLVVNGTGISVAYDAANHALTFSGSGSYAEYAGIARGVVLTNASGTLDPGTRQFSITVYDENGGHDSVTTNAAIGTVGSSDPAVLAGTALPEVRWSADGAAVLGETTTTVPYGSAGSVDGGSGLDALAVDGTSDWLFQVRDGGSTVLATNADDDSFVVRLDHGTATVDGNGDVVFNGDASGRIEFDQTNHLQFDNLDRLLG